MCYKLMHNPLKGGVCLQGEMEAGSKASGDGVQFLESESPGF